MKSQAAYSHWKEYLFIDEIEKFEELTATQEEFLVTLSLKYQGAWKEEILKKVSQEFFEFYEEEQQAEGIKIQALDLEGLESGTWQMMFEDEEEDHLVHVYFKDWEIDYVV